MVNRSIAGVCAGVLLAFAATSAHSSAGPWAVPTKFDTASTHLLIQVDVNGTPLWCNLDTGFSALIVIDRAEAVRAGVKERSGTPTPDGNRPNDGDGSATARVTVGPATIQAQR